MPSTTITSTGACAAKGATISSRMRSTGRIPSPGCSRSDGGSCGGSYFAQAGNLQLNTATQNYTAGNMSGTMSNVRFDEWDFTNDLRVSGGRCVILQTKPFNASWP